jgi:hypothetical protein
LVEAWDLEALDLEALDLEALDLEALDLEALDLEALDLEALAFFVASRGSPDLAADRVFLTRVAAAGFDLDGSLRVIFGMIRVY